MTVVEFMQTCTFTKDLWKLDLIVHLITIQIRFTITL